MEMKVKASWLIACAWSWWVYFITAVFLYAYLKVSWVNTFDLLLGLAVLLVLSVWYVPDRIRYRDSSQPQNLTG
jgi:hypothetical protein